MNLSRLRPWFLAAVAALTLGAIATYVAATPNKGGYMVFNSLNTSYEPSGSILSLTGQITNMCTENLPEGSTLAFAFDNYNFVSLTLTTALSVGGVQPFSVYGTIPTNLPPPKKGITSLDFTIDLPTARIIGQQKSSPCIVTLVPGTPMQ